MIETLDQLTLIEDEHEPRNLQLHLDQNYPNPFNPSTEIRYSLPKKSHLILTVHNLQGRTIRHLDNDTKPAGTYSVIWDGRDDFNTQVSSGVYFIVFQAGDFTQIRKALLIR